MSNLTITPLPAFKDNYIWIISHPQSDKVAVVDPGDAEVVINYLKGNNLQLAAVLVTHHHWDHAGGIAELIQHYSAPVFGPAHDKVPEVDHPLKEGDLIKIDALNAEFKVLDIPAHTHGHIAIIGHGILFSGDTLFLAGCGRVFEGTHEQMYASLCKLKDLPDETLVYCGHEYTENNLRFAMIVEPENAIIADRLAEVTSLRSNELPTVPATIALEKLSNPFLRCEMASVKAGAEDHAGTDLPSPLDIFSVLRQWKDSF